MRRIDRRWVVAASLVVAVVSLAWGLGQRQTRDGLRNALEAAYQRQFYTLIDQTEQLNVLIGKTLVSSSAPQTVAQLSEIWLRANAAQDALTNLPVTGVNLSSTRKFLAQLGDYAHSLSRQDRSRTALTQEEKERLARFEDELAKLSSQLHSLQARLERTGFRWAQAAPGTTRPLGNQRGAQAQGPQGPDDLRVLGDVEKRLQQMPTLIYDGPFSDHMEDVRKPRGLKGPVIGQDEAQGIARRFADLPPGYRLVGKPNTVRGRFPTFAATFQTRNAPTRIIVHVTRQGGHPALLMNSRSVDASRIGAEDAQRRAGDFLRKKGFAEMIPTFTAQDNNAATISFVPRRDGVVIYPEQVKVKVALDNGQVVGFDATGYWTFHQDRKLSSPRLRAEEAAARVSPSVQVEETRLALIPDRAGKEILAYEVRGRRSDGTYLVYINAMNGKEEAILKLVDTPSGRLTM